MEVTLLFCRGARIRTGDLTDPNRARWPTALRPVLGMIIVQRTHFVKGAKGKKQEAESKVCSPNLGALAFLRRCVYSSGFHTNVPFRRSRSACSISSRVFITNGP
jgi:hypothetical protein